MDKEKEIENYLYNNFDPEKPFNDVFPASRYEWHRAKCKAIAQDVVRIINGEEVKRKPSSPCDTGPR